MNYHVLVNCLVIMSSQRACKENTSADGAVGKFQELGCLRPFAILLLNGRHISKKTSTISENHFKIQLRVMKRCSNFTRNQRAIAQIKPQSSAVL